MLNANTLPIPTHTSLECRPKKILTILPELKRNEPVHLSHAAKKLRDAGVLAKTASSVMLFRRHPAQFELTPEQQPNTVRYRG